MNEVLLAPITPGDILLEEFMYPHGINTSDLAERTGLPKDWIEGFILDQRRLTDEAAQCFGNYFNTSAVFWKNLQSNYDKRIGKDT